MNVDQIVGFGALWIAIPVAMLAGLISFLSPCVLPLVPGYLGFIGGSVTPRAAQPGDAARAPGRGRLVLGVLLFILGFTIVFMAYNTIGGVVGAFLARWADLLTRILGALIVVMGFVFLGFFGIAQREVRFHVTSRTGLFGAPLLGVALGLGWAPCLGPTLSAITAVSINLGDPARASLLGFFYAMGLGIPFLLVALGFGWAAKALGFFRRYIRVVNIVGGVLLIAIGLLMVSGLWTMVMLRLQGVMASVILPI